MADLSQIASSKRDSIGRYFSLVSAIPSAMLIAWAVLLVGGGAWTGTPDVNAALRVFAEIGIGGAAGLVLAAIVLGVLLHPMQFAFVRFLEGYWGGLAHRPAGAAAAHQGALGAGVRAAGRACSPRQAS